MGIGVYARRLGRRDNDPSPRRDDWAVNTTILLMALGAAFADLRAGASIIAVRIAWVLGILFAVFVSINHDRFESWERDEKGLPLHKKRLFFGIVLPDLCSLVIFGLFQALK